jgi:hypothetical protein
MQQPSGTWTTMLTQSTLFAAIASALTCLACTAGDQVYLMQTAYLVDAEGNESFAGGGCESVGGDGGGVSGLAGERFSIVHAHVGDGVRVTVRDGTSVARVERFYSIDFLASGMEEEIAVELSDGNTLRVRYWGGPDCIPPDAGD